MIKTADEFVKLLDANDRRAVYEEAPGDVWDELVDSRPELRVWVVRNKTVPLGLLRRLADDPDPLVRHAVAMKRKCDQPLLEKLARDICDLVRMRVAWNAKTTAATLKVLANDRDPNVAEAAKQRLDCIANGETDGF